MYDFIKLLNFLHKADQLFPIPLSTKHNLKEFAEKLCDKATMCTAIEDGNIVALLAGYTDNVENNLGYISIVATLPQAQGKGYGTLLIREFLDIARTKGLRAVHLYAVRENIPAMRMYNKLGFEDYVLDDEPRPNDAHLIYYFSKEVLE